MICSEWCSECFADLVFPGYCPSGYVYSLLKQPEPTNKPNATMDGETAPGGEGRELRQAPNQLEPKAG